MEPKNIAGFALIAVGGLDLAFGNTNTPMLPAPIANVLTQQLDLVLIGAGVFIIWML